MKRLTIRVTQEDIDDGERRNGEQCPIALAMSRALGDDYVSVGDEYVTGSVYDWELSRTARQWVRRYDDGLRVAPATFRVSVW